ncbi:hypothetical protein Tco_1333047, partial [Tanacetum coccineum]
NAPGHISAAIHFWGCYTMDDFLKLPQWNVTVMSKGDPIPNARKANEASGSEFGETVSVTLIHQANRKRLSETITSCPKGTAGTATIGSWPANVEKEVVNLSENTHVPTNPPVNTTQEEQIKHSNTQVRVVYSDAHSFHSVHNEYNDEDVACRYVLRWGLHEDLRICSYRACKELISHMATLTKDEVLSNGEVVRRTYQSLGRSILSQAELLKRCKQLNRDHVDLCNHNETQLEELGRLRTDL